jgi:hypothetical protein
MAHTITPLEHRFEVGLVFNGWKIDRRSHQSTLPNCDRAALVNIGFRDLAGHLS